MIRWYIFVFVLIVDGADEATLPIHVIGQQDIVPLPSTTTVTTPKRTNELETIEAGKTTAS